MEQQTEYGNGEHERFTDEELKMLDEIPVWHLNFFLNMPSYSVGKAKNITNIAKIKDGLSRFVSSSKMHTMINDYLHTDADEQLCEYNHSVRGIHEIDTIGSVLSLMFPIMGFPKEKGLLRIRLLRAAGVDVTGISTELTFKEAYELDKQVISIRALKLFIECNTFFTDYLCVATFKIWRKYIEQNKNYHSDFDNAVEAALFGENEIKKSEKPAQHSELQVQVLLRIRKPMLGKKNKADIFKKCQELEPNLFGNIKRNRFDQIWVAANGRDKEAEQG